MCITSHFFSKNYCEGRPVRVECEFVRFYNKKRSILRVGIEVCYEI